MSATDVAWPGGAGGVSCRKHRMVPRNRGASGAAMCAGRRWAGHSPSWIPRRRIRSAVVALGAGEDQPADSVGVRLNDVLVRWIEGAESAAFRCEHEHRRARPREDVIEV